jgi:hypothetical protein
MIRRAIFPLLCGAALTVATLPGVARVGVFVGVVPPAPVLEMVPAPPAQAAGLLELERHAVCLGTGRLCRGPFSTRGMGARKVGQTPRRLGRERWPLAAVK